MTEAILASAVALTIGIVWAVRIGNFLAERFLPILSLVVGCGIVFAMGVRGADIITSGVMIGLMASGAWSGGKTLVRGSTTTRN